jgi:hypothetical protein
MEKAERPFSSTSRMARETIFAPDKRLLDFGPRLQGMGG